MTGIESKVEFIGKVRSTWELQAGTVIGQIADDARECRMVSQHERGSLEYYRPLKAAALAHGLTSTHNSTRSSYCE
jgi:hypothetical protein